MKKLLLTLAALALFGAASANNTPIEIKNLPQKVTTFLAKHFPSYKINTSTADKELNGTQYTVYLSAGAKIEFNTNGSWSEIECRSSEVPSSIIPTKIASYITKNYAGAKILKIDVDKTNYELKLSNSTELEFDLNGNFLRIDN